MNKLYVSLFLICCYIFPHNIKASETISIVISDQKTKEKIPFATIQMIKNLSIGWMSDLNGNFLINNAGSKINLKDKLVVKSLGYKTDTLSLQQIKKLNYKITLQPLAYNLSEVIVRPSHNIALDIIKKVIEHKHKNSPASIQYISCNKYNKTTLDLIPNPKYYTDSTIKNFKNVFDKTHLLLSEKYSNIIINDGVIANEHVISYRVSGFQKPIIENFITQIQPFHFYNPIITMFENTYINPISKSGIHNYGFQIIDTLYTNSDKLISIEYYPKFKNKSLLKGKLNISLNSYAIVVVTAEPAVQDLIYLKIEQEYKKKNHHYLPSSYSYQLAFKKYPSKKSPAKLNSQSYISDYQFDNATSGEQKTKLIPIQKTRTIELSLKEKNTYKKIDSIGKRYKFDKKLNFLNKFAIGRIPFKIIDFDLNENMFNKHEGFRSSIGVYSNEKISKKIRIGGYIAYGEKDKQKKYGASIEYKFNKQKISFEAKYKDDLAEYGILENPFLKRNALRQFMIDSMYHIKSYEFNIQKKINNSIVLIGIRKEEDFEYGNSSNISKFTEAFIHCMINLNKNKKKVYEPNTISYKYPIVYFTFMHTENNDANIKSYQRLSCSFDYSFYIDRVGKQSVFISYNRIFSNYEIPLYKLISGYGANVSSLPFYANNSFQTMLPYEFFHTESFTIHYKGTFLKPLFYSRLSEPQINLHQSFGIGNNKSLINNNLNAFNKGYFESGFSINNLIKINYLNMAYIGLGAGIFTRYGSYAFKESKKNYIFKIHLSVVL